MTLLGVFNRVCSWVADRALAHEVLPEGADDWHPWWHGRHVRGSWHWRKAPGWVR